MMTSAKSFNHARRPVLWIALLAGCLLSSCDGSGPNTSAAPKPRALGILSAPRLDLNPNPDAPLVGILSVETDRPSRATLNVTAGVDSWSIPLSPYRTKHSDPVVGFRPNTAHAVQVTLVDQDGNAATYPKNVIFTTGPLPANFPPLSAVVTTPAQMEPGLTLLEPYGPAGASHLVALDASGNVVWYYKPTALPGRMLDARRISNGNITFTILQQDFLEITPVGDIVTHLYANADPGVPPAPAGSVPIAIASLHHEVSPMPSGHFVGLSQEVRTYLNYPASETDPSKIAPSTAVLGDVIVEFARDGTVVHSWYLLDMLDPYRIGYGSLVTTPQAAKDWSHANAVVYDPNSDSFIVSVRHQDVVIKFKRNLASNGRPSDLVWMLGNHDRWGANWQRYLLYPTNFNLWPYHQHASMVMTNGDILLHDNGNFRATPPATPTPDSLNFSRAVQYHIDEASMVVTQVWEYGSPATESQPVYSLALGDADELPLTGNVLSSFGFVTYIGGVATVNPVSRVVETAKTGQVVFRLDIGINDPNPAKAASVQNYRADRVPTLNP